MSEQAHRRLGRSGWLATSSAPLTTVNHTSFKALMVLKTLPERYRIALAGFKRRWNQSKWMQDQHGYVRRACLATASGQSQGVSFCQCGLDYYNRFSKHCFQTCGQEHVCPSCNKNNRVEPCKREYLQAFERAPYWYALSAGWQSSPRQAGLHWVTKQDDNGRATAKKHWLPFAGRADAPYTPRYSVESLDELQLMAELPFKFAERLVNRGWFDGLYCVFEWAFAFYPAPRGWCYHTALPHLHFFGNRRQPLIFEEGIEIQKLYQRTCLKSLGEELLPAYPDLEIAPIVSRSRLSGWINYQIKAMPLEEFYREGIRNGCPLTDLNLEFHQTVWEAIKLVRSPRKYGNLFALDPDYIGVRQYRKLSAGQLERLNQKVEDRVPLTAKEARQLEHHELALEQQKQYRLEKKRRREEAKLKRPDVPDVEVAVPLKIS